MKALIRYEMTMVTGGKGQFTSTALLAEFSESALERARQQTEASLKPLHISKLEVVNAVRLDDDGSSGCDADKVAALTLLDEFRLQMRRQPDVYQDAQLLARAERLLADTELVGDWKRPD